MADQKCTLDMNTPQGEAHITGDAAFVGAAADGAMRALQGDENGAGAVSFAELIAKGGRFAVGCSGGERTNGPDGGPSGTPRANTPPGPGKVAY